MKKICDKDIDVASINGKSEQAGVVQEENTCDVLTAQSGKKKYSNAWLLDLRFTHHMWLKREWFST